MASHFRRTIVLVALGWVLFLVIVLAVVRLVRGPAAEQAGIEVPIFPGAGRVIEQRSPAIGFQSYEYRVDVDYPSAAVWDFYNEALTRRGWRQRPQIGRPEWTTQRQDDNNYDILAGQWIDPRGLHQLQLTATSMEEVKRDPDSGQVISRIRRPGLHVIAKVWAVVIPGGEPDGKSAP
jgi:hypothetical protein